MSLNMFLIVFEKILVFFKKKREDFFFFQAEDGIRDWSVTGVQTCALPIWAPTRARHGVSGLGSLRPQVRRLSRRHRNRRAVRPAGRSGAPPGLSVRPPPAPGEDDRQLDRKSVV